MKTPTVRPDHLCAPTPPTTARPAVFRSRSWLLGAAAIVALSATVPKPALALTIMLNFVSAATTDTNGVTTIAESFSSWGFTGLDLNGVRQATLDNVRADYLGYPTFATNGFSPLPAGKELNIDFEFSNGLSAPLSGDSEWYVMNIGDASPNVSFLGQACLGCVRSAAGLPTVPVGTVFGTSATDSIAGLLNLATTDQQRLNLLAGTAAHEVGHSFGLLHPSAALANPGQSSFSIMATGAAPTSMPNNQRILDRAFAYTEFAMLIGRIGLRDVTAVPEPSTTVLLALGVVALGLRLQFRLQMRKRSQRG